MEFAGEAEPVESVLALRAAEELPEIEDKAGERILGSTRPCHSGSVGGQPVSTLLQNGRDLKTSFSAEFTSW